MRLFFAVDIPAELKDSVAKIAEKLEGLDIKFVEKENLHITLKFLGEVPDGKVEEIVGRAKCLLAGIKGFRVSLEGLSHFGPDNYIRVVWVGVKGGREKLAALEKTFEQAFADFRAETFVQLPHLTLGRGKSADSSAVLSAKIKGLSEVKVGEFILSEIKLKKSVLGKSGPVYSDVEVFRLSYRE